MPGFSEAELKIKWAAFVKAHPQFNENQLLIEATGLTFADSEQRKLKIDFLKNRELYGRIPLGKNELLARAIGFKKGVEKVLDVTAGLGSDSLFMARMGLQVVATERNPLVYFLISNAWHLAVNFQSQDPFELRTIQALRNVQFLNLDLLGHLDATQEVDAPDAIYIDPMYPHTNKTALPRQEMVVFRNLVGADEDSGQLLQLALKVAKTRVVVKRPLKGDNLGDKPDHTFLGKTVRYDLYMVK